MGNNVAKLSPEQIAKLKQLEQELKVVIVAYEK
jgi:hypothetical protein